MSFHNPSGSAEPARMPVFELVVVAVLITAIIGVSVSTAFDAMRARPVSACGALQFGGRDAS